MRTGYGILVSFLVEVKNMPIEVLEEIHRKAIKG
jgi:hypothetical protein